MTKKYSIEFTENQLRVLSKGLEFYSRFLAGQWEIPAAMQFEEYVLQDKYEGFWEKRNYVESELKILKSHFTGMGINESRGIGSDNLHEDAKVSYDIYRPVLEQFAKEYNVENPDKKCYSVYDHPGLQYGEEGRIKIDVKDEESK
jgi:hypothetical protein